MFTVDPLLATILRVDTRDAQDCALSILESAYPADAITVDADYVYARGNIPVCLVAHTDTVHCSPPADLYCDTAKGILWSPQGLGADDRAGVYAIAAILRDTSLRPHVLFTDGEETGGRGAAAVASTLDCPPGLRVLLQLDRAGATDAVLYQCHSRALLRYLRPYGYRLASGSYTDIVDIMPAWGLAGANLSIGYAQQHTRGEYLNLASLSNTIRQVRKMLAHPPKRPFTYAEQPPRKPALPSCTNNDALALMYENYRRRSVLTDPASFNDDVEDAWTRWDQEGF